MCQPATIELFVKVNLLIVQTHSMYDTSTEHVLCVCVYKAVSLHSCVSTLRFQLVSSFPPCSLVRALVVFLELVWSSWLCKEERHHVLPQLSLSLSNIYTTHYALHFHHFILLTCHLFTISHLHVCCIHSMCSIHIIAMSLMKGEI